ncbi:hypothetical protein EYV94_09010 [Puteibacter caeruleilacunae]|nr:hypothetical protein EYV94_09010 [Puteibacter caeruleilacunae]
MMRYLLLLIVSFFLFISCDDNEEQDVPVYGVFNYMYLNQLGGGQLCMNVLPLEEIDSLDIFISKRNFVDTIIQFKLGKSDIENSAYDALINACNANLRLDGDYKPSRLPTGSSSHYYFINEHDSVKVTNRYLLSELLKIENTVRKEIRKEE